ncbi:hypothetical protein NUW54_g1392 [Trametes sanguinea]|uniref:Uncharacterized protein n=1 Tax=Trametes sanguinea TaxID=158606 RepID=A0ACC1Q9N6_9APHY|nr:hypothetical protein NUW54_g1392 [Trametes sanguinea]
MSFLSPASQPHRAKDDLGVIRRQLTTSKQKLLDIVDSKNLQVVAQGIEGSDLGIWHPHLVPKSPHHLKQGLGSLGSVTVVGEDVIHGPLTISISEVSHLSFKLTWEQLVIVGLMNAKQRHVEDVVDTSLMQVAWAQYSSATVFELALQEGNILGGDIDQISLDKSKDTVVGRHDCLFDTLSIHVHSRIHLCFRIIPQHGARHATSVEEEQGIPCYVGPSYSGAQKSCPWGMRDPSLYPSASRIIPFGLKMFTDIDWLSTLMEHGAKPCDAAGEIGCDPSTMRRSFANLQKNPNFKAKRHHPGRPRKLDQYVKRTFFPEVGESTVRHNLVEIGLHDCIPWAKPHLRDEHVAA